MRIRVYYWSEDGRAGKLGTIITKTLEKAGHEVRTCENLFGKNPAHGFHGQTMINVFRDTASNYKTKDGKNPVEKALEHLCARIRRDSIEPESDIQLFVVHVDGESLPNAEDKIYKKIIFILNHFKQQKTLIDSSPELKILTCIPMQEFENWVLPLIDPKCMGQDVDSISEAKAKVRKILNCSPINQKENDEEISKVITSCNLDTLSKPSQSYGSFEESIHKTLGCEMGAIRPSRNSRQ